MDGIGSLPEELWMLILEDLPNLSYGRFAGTCSTARRLCCDEQLVRTRQAKGLSIKVTTNDGNGGGDGSGRIRIEEGRRGGERWGLVRVILSQWVIYHLGDLRKIFSQMLFGTDEERLVGVRSFTRRATTSLSSSSPGHQMVIEWSYPIVNQTIVTKAYGARRPISTFLVKVTNGVMELIVGYLNDNKINRVRCTVVREGEGDGNNGTNICYYHLNPYKAKRPFQVGTLSVRWSSNDVSFKYKSEVADRCEWKVLIGRGGYPLSRRSSIVSCEYGGIPIEHFTRFEGNLNGVVSLSYRSILLERSQVSPSPLLTIGCKVGETEIGQVLLEQYRLIRTEDEERRRRCVRSCIPSCTFALLNL